MSIDIGNDFQKGVYLECIKQQRGYGLSLPMGSGKTLLSILIALEKTKEPNPSKILVIVSKTLVCSWVAEINKFFGDKLEYIILHSDFCDMSRIDIPDTCRLVITTPEVISKQYNEEIKNKFIHREIFNAGHFNQYEVVYYNVVDEPLKSFIPGDYSIDNIIYTTKWGYVIIDEVQGYTNITSKRTRAIAALCAVQRMAMSGTLFDEPKIERILGYNLIINDPFFPRNLPDAQRHCKVAFPGFKNVDNYVFRDSNDAFITPNVHKKIITHSLSPDEQIIYKVIKQVVDRINKLTTQYRMDGLVEQQRRFNSYLLAMITYLRQILVCPLIPITKMYIDSLDFKGRSELSKILKDSIEEQNLSEYMNNIDSVESSRIKEVNKVISAHSTERVIVFTCFRTCLDVMKSFLPENRPAFTLSAIQNAKSREETLNLFAKSDTGVLYLTFDLGANGLNLQHCSTILLVDCWWNSGKMAQAIARVLRYGQESENVNIYFFSSNTGIENAIFKKQDEKLIMLKELETGAMSSTLGSVNTREIIKIITQDENTRIMRKTWGM